MLVLAGIIMIIIGRIIANKFYDDMLGDIITVSGWVISVILILIALLVRFDTATIEIRRNSLQESYTNARNLSEFERVEITRDIATFNKELAENKYWNESILFDWWIDDIVETTDPIK